MRHLLYGTPTNVARMSIEITTNVKFKTNCTNDHRLLAWNAYLQFTNYLFNIVHISSESIYLPRQTNKQSNTLLLSNNNKKEALHSFYLSNISQQSHFRRVLLNTITISNYFVILEFVVYFRILIYVVYFVKCNVLISRRCAKFSQFLFLCNNI